MSKTTQKAATPARATLLFTVFLAFLTLLPVSIGSAQAEPSAEPTAFVRQ